MSAYSQLILNNGPLDYLRLDEASGTVAHDISGNNLNGTIAGTVTYSQPGAIVGDSDTALKFDGTSAKITMPSGSSVVGYGKLTLEAWVKLSTNSFGHLA